MFHALEIIHDTSRVDPFSLPNDKIYRYRSSNSAGTNCVKIQSRFLVLVKKMGKRYVGNQCNTYSGTSSHTLTISDICGVE